MKNSKAILIFLVCLMLVIMGYRYKEYIYDRDFVVLASVMCEPGDASCFFWDCTTEEEPECDTYPYEKIEIKAYEAPGCLLENDCEDFFCENYSSCRPVICTEVTAAYWEGCIDPRMYEWETEIMGVDEAQLEIEQDHIFKESSSESE